MSKESKAMSAWKRSAPPLLALALAACHQAPLVQGPGPEVAPAAAVALLGQGDREARVLLSAPALAYALQALPSPATVHRWVPGDIVRYEVELRQRNATTLTQFDAFANPVVLQVPVGGNATGLATFGQLRQGSFYRAYVKAMGRKGGASGTDTIQALNAAATDDFADFDFTAANDVASKVERSVTIDFDAVAFSGTGAIAFGTPSPGVFVNPSDAPSASVVTPSPQN